MIPKAQIVHPQALTLGPKGEVVPTRVFDFSIFAPPRAPRCLYCQTIATPDPHCQSCGAPR